MGNFFCRCGYHMPLKTGVEDYEKYIVSKRIMNVDLIREVRKEEFELDEFFRIFDEDAISTLICPSCKRIWLSEKGKMKAFIAECVPSQGTTDES